ncbi:uncharacterized protein LOC101847599 isoform X2 [Aplysia californica]|uniref:Uncharacterized protein LOC101847599 isoform X2 n=1 Tax=Aplysia californica TaxID=6500 RepID=A0ABM0JXQ5_APLCA|nr:uncharacterized protein LOC101847599 isoform X2 [Aplysia californica]
MAELTVGPPTVSSGTGFGTLTLDMFSAVSPNLPMLLDGTLSEESYKNCENNRGVCAVLSDAHVLFSQNTSHCSPVPSNKPLLHCNFCEFRTGSEAEMVLLKHLLGHHAFFCSMCDHVAFSKSSYIEHMLQRHKLSKEWKQVSTSRLMQLKEKRGLRQWEGDKTTSSVNKGGQRKERSTLENVLLGVQPSTVPIPAFEEAVCEGNSWDMSGSFTNIGTSSHLAFSKTGCVGTSDPNFKQVEIPGSFTGDETGGRTTGNFQTPCDGNTFHKDQIMCPRPPNFLEETDGDGVPERTPTEASEKDNAGRLWENSLLGIDHNGYSVLEESKCFAHDLYCCEVQGVKSEKDISAETSKSSPVNEPFIALGNDIGTDLCQTGAVKEDHVPILSCNDKLVMGVKQESASCSRDKEVDVISESQSVVWNNNNEVVRIKEEPEEDVPELSPGHFEYDNAESEMPGLSGRDPGPELPVLCAERLQKQMEEVVSEVVTSEAVEVGTPCSSSLLANGLQNSDRLCVDSFHGPNSPTPVPEDFLNSQETSRDIHSKAKKYDLLRSLLKRQNDVVIRTESKRRALTSVVSSHDSGHIESPGGGGVLEVPAQVPSLRPSDLSLREILSQGNSSLSSRESLLSLGCTPTHKNSSTCKELLTQGSSHYSNGVGKNDNDHIESEGGGSVSIKEEIEENTDDAAPCHVGENVQVKQQPRGSPLFDDSRVSRSEDASVYCGGDNEVRVPTAQTAAPLTAGEGQRPSTSHFTASEILKRLLVSVGTSIPKDSSSSLFAASGEFFSSALAVGAEGEGAAPASLLVPRLRRSRRVRRTESSSYSVNETDRTDLDPADEVENTPEGQSDDSDFVYCSDKDGEHEEDSGDSDFSVHKTNKRRKISKRGPEKAPGLGDDSSAVTEQLESSVQAPAVAVASATRGEWLLACSVCPFTTLKVGDMRQHLLHNHSQAPATANLAVEDRIVLIYFCRGGGGVRDCQFFSSEGQEIYQHIITCYQDQLAGSVTDNTGADHTPVLSALSKFCRPNGSFSMLYFCLQCVHTTSSQQPMIDHAQVHHSGQDFGVLAAGNLGPSSQSYMLCLKCKHLVKFREWSSHQCRGWGDRSLRSMLTSDSQPEVKAMPSGSQLNRTIPPSSSSTSLMHSLTIPPSSSSTSLMHSLTIPPSSSSTSLMHSLTIPPSGFSTSLLNSPSIPPSNSSTSLMNSLTIPPSNSLTIPPSSSSTSLLNSPSIPPSSSSTSLLNSLTIPPSNSLTIPPSNSLTIPPSNCSTSSNSSTIPRQAQPEEKARGHEVPFPSTNLLRFLLAQSQKSSFQQ